MKNFTSLKNILMGTVKKGATEYQSNLIKNSDTTPISTAVLVESQKNLIDWELKNIKPDIDELVILFLGMNMHGTESTSFLIHHQGFKDQPRIQSIVMLRLLKMEAFGLALRKDANGRTALMEASSVGNAALVELLIRAGAYLNVQDNNGDTALILAARHDHVDAFTILHEYGAREDITNDVGQTVWTLPHPNIDLARRRGTFDTPFITEDFNNSISDFRELNIHDFREVMDEPGDNSRKQKLK